MGRLEPSSSTLFLVLIVLCVLVGSVVVFRLSREVEEDSGPLTDDDVRRDLERAFYAGEMDRAEFDRVTASLDSRRGAASKPAAAKPVESPPRPAPDAPGSEIGPA